MQIELELVIYGIASVILSIITVAVLSMGKVIDGHPKAVSKGNCPEWSKPVPATRLFAGVCDAMFIVGGVLVYFAQDPIIWVLGVVLVFAAILTMLQTLMFCGVVLGRLNVNGDGV